MRITTRLLERWAAHGRRWIVLGLLATTLLGCETTGSKADDPDTAEFVAPSGPDLTEAISNHDVLMQGKVGFPPLLTPFVDPVFGTTITRITDAKTFPGGPKPGLFPYYSKRQAWNVDESYLVLASDDGSTMLFDGETYGFVKVLDGVGGGDVFWHPVHRNILLYAGADDADVPCLFSFNIDTNERSVVYRFSGYVYADTNGEGHLSDDGKSYAVVLSQYDRRTEEVLYKRLQLISLDESGGRLRGSLVSSLDLPPVLNGFDWVSVSPSGKYIVVDYATDNTGNFEGVEVYDRQFHRLWQKPMGAGHSDLTRNAKGKELLIMDQYDGARDKTIFKSLDLTTGDEVELLATSGSFDQHISCRSSAAKDWCTISTFDFVGRLEDKADIASLDWLPFEDEIFMLKIDGSKAVRRLAHHHSRRYSPQTSDSGISVYWSEPHATVSPSGKRILFGSNWRRGIDQVSSVNAYVVDL